MPKVVAVQQVACGGQRHKLLLMDDGRLTMKHHSRRAIAVFDYMTEGTTQCEAVFKAITGADGLTTDCGVVAINKAFKHYLWACHQKREARALRRAVYLHPNEPHVVAGIKQHLLSDWRSVIRHDNESIPEYGRRVLFMLLSKEWQRWGNGTQIAMAFCCSPKAYLSNRGKTTAWFYSAHLPASWYRTVYIRTKAAFTRDGELILHIYEPVPEGYRAELVVKRPTHQTASAIITREGDGWRVKR